MKNLQSADRASALHFLSGDISFPNQAREIEIDIADKVMWNFLLLKLIIYKI